MSRIPKPYEIYKHFKGRLYQILTVAEHSETGEKLVIYQAMYGDFKIYARPLTNFMEEVDRVKYPEAGQTCRFELLTQEPAEIQGSPEKLTTTFKTVEKAAGEAEPKQTQESEQTQESPELQDTDTEECNIDPKVLQFLEADTCEERLNILVGCKGCITDEMITTMAVACDVEVPEGDLEERYESLKSCLSTLVKFECNRLR